MPSATKGPNNHSPGAVYTITHDGGVATGTFSLSYQNTGLPDQWYLIGSSLKFAAGTSGTIRITNNYPTSSSTERFSMDAIKLTFVQPVPVAVTGWQVD
ncbi:MAG: hypothetical protein ACR2IE_04765 [Candidatus Sumerlaeaceae bacterium]